MEGDHNLHTPTPLITLATCLSTLVYIVILSKGPALWLRAITKVALCMLEFGTKVVVFYSASSLIHTLPLNPDL